MLGSLTLRRSGPPYKLAHPTSLKRAQTLSTCRAAETGVDVVPPDLIPTPPLSSTGNPFHLISRRWARLSGAHTAGTLSKFQFQLPVECTSRALGRCIASAVRCLIGSGGVLLPLLLVLGCSSTIYQAASLPAEFRVPAASDVNRVNFTRLSGSRASNSQIGIGDILELTVSTGYETTQVRTIPMAVREDGTANVPLLGLVPVAGLEPAEAERVIQVQQETLAKRKAEVEAAFQKKQNDQFVALLLHQKQAEEIIRRQQEEEEGYQLAYVEDVRGAVAVAGFRISENLAWGRFLYVDDLVTLAEHRSKGYGAHLLGWMHDFARSQGCRELHLDSGTQRTEAHRFYKQQGMQLSSYHFKTVVQ